MAGSVATRYCDAGKGTKVVLLLHGYGESLDVWDDFAGVLGKSLRVVRMDLPGSGFSDWGARDTITIDFMASVAADLLDKLGIETCTVVGHSMGGYVAVAMADLFASKVEKLVLMHSTPYGDSSEKVEMRKREIALVGEGKKELLVKINAAKGFAPQNTGRFSEAIDELAEQIMLTPDQAIMATLRGMSERADRSAVFASLNIPSLMFLGLYDAYIPVEFARKMESQFPLTEIFWLDASGHTGFIEQRDVVAQKLIEFVII